MKVYLAAIQHKNGTNLVAGGSKEELLKKLADYCRGHAPFDWCGEWLPSTADEINALSDEDAVEKYFEGHPCEWVEEDSDEIGASPDTLEQQFDAPADPAIDIQALMQQGMIVCGIVQVGGAVIMSGIVTND
jgi:hypothetical protein